MLYKVGELFPDLNHGVGQDYAIIKVIEGGTFDFLMYIRDPTEMEIEASRSGSIRYAIFTEQYIPFFIIDFGEFSMDAPINIHKLQNETVLKWINDQANAVTIVLIDTITNKILGLRVIGINMDAMLHLKRTCLLQFEVYHQALNVDVVTDHLMKKYNTTEMLKRSIKYDL